MKSLLDEVVVNDPQQPFRNEIGNVIVLPAPNGLIVYGPDGFPEKLLIDEAVTYLIRELHIKTIETNHIMMYYKNGVYKEGGDELCKQLLIKFFHGLITNQNESIIDRKILDEIINKIIYLTPVKLQDFDADIALINMKNGIYNWQTGEFHKHTPDYLSSIQIPIEYRKHAKCPTIEMVLKDCVYNKYYILCLEFIAYLLYRGYDIQKAIILFGPGRTGKSWYLDLCKNFVGLENCSTESMQALSHDKFAAANLFRKLLNECGDLDSEMIRATGTFKKLSSKDVITVQKKFQDSYQMANFAKMLFASNMMPPTNDKTTGFIRRVIIIPFTRIFREDEYDEKRIRCNEDKIELSGLFNLVIPYLKPLLERMKFTNNPSNEEVAALYNSASNTVESFAEERIYEEPTSFISKERLYNTYVLYCRQHFCIAAPRNAFSREFAKIANYVKPGNRLNTSNKRVPVWLYCNFI